MTGVTQLLARELIGHAVRDERGHRIGHVRDIGFGDGRIRSLRTERGVYTALRRVGDRLVAGAVTQPSDAFLREDPLLDRQGTWRVYDLVLSEGLEAPLYVVSRGLWHDVVHGREVVPASRVESPRSGHGLP